MIALGIGAKIKDDLIFLHEEMGLAVFRTYGVIPGMDFMTDINKDIALDYTKLLHGEQILEVHRKIPKNASTTSRGKLTEILGDLG